MEARKLRDQSQVVQSKPIITSVVLITMICRKLGMNSHHRNGYKYSINTSFPANNHKQSSVRFLFIREPLQKKFDAVTSQGQALIKSAPHLLFFLFFRLSSSV
ncbi:hypothetical protein V1264_010589 [Littorina saxatilis]|uniref:Uncharacterized protein n=1 Tax=Littorina saxatilis TaxID=31220 RepID=A0AAN9G124_9CAEN